MPILLELLFLKSAQLNFEKLKKWSRQSIGNLNSKCEDLETLILNLQLKKANDGPNDRELEHLIKLNFLMFILNKMRFPPMRIRCVHECVFGVRLFLIQTFLANWLTSTLSALFHHLIA